MNSNFITLGSVCCTLLCGSVFAEKMSSPKIFVGKFIEDVRNTQRVFSEENRIRKTLSPRWFSAAESGDLKTMKSLYEDHFKHNIYEKDDSGRTALEIAIINGHCNIVEWLADCIKKQEDLDKASNFNLRSENKSGKPMMIVAVENGYEDIVKFMLSRLMNPDVIIDKSNLGQTPLIVASEKGYTNIVDLLLTSKGDPKLLRLDHSRANPDLTDWVGKTALMYAAKKGYTDIVKLLLENGANPDKKDESKNTALILASLYGHESIVKLLLEYGADLDVKDSDKGTALIYAVKEKYFNIARLLLDYGAKINIKNKNKKTALDYAEGNAKLTELLQNYVDRPENQEKANFAKRAWSKITKKTVKSEDKKDIQRRRLSTDSEATLYDDDEEKTDIDDVLSISTDTLVEE